MAKAIKLIMAIAIILLLLFLPSLGLKIAKADELVVTEFDKSYVTDDLSQMKINGVQFDELDYPVNLNDHNVTLLNFVEYMYTYDDAARQHYGVYLYFYNPSQKDIIYSNSNKIQIANEYDKDGNPISYAKYTLKLVNYSTGAQNKVFLKFKAEFDDGFIKTLNRNARAYSVSGVELFESNKNTAVEYPIRSKWIFSGYAVGCGEDGKNTESTLQVNYTTLEAITLNVKDTYYRQDNISSQGEGHQNEINSVYFAVPNRYIDNYGNLQKIKCEYYEYKTMPIICQPWEEAYSFYADLATNAELPESLPQIQIYNTVLDTYKNTGVLKYELLSKLSNYSWNKDPLYSTKGEKNPDSEKTLHYNEWIHRLIFDHQNISESELKEYIYNYANSYITGYIDIKDGTLSNDLFSESVDAGHTRGYNLVELDANDEFNMLSYDSNHSWWDKFWDFGFWAPDTAGDIKNIKAIEAVPLDYLLTSTADSLLINDSDWTNFKNYCNEAYANDCTPFLFRFSVTDYYSINTSVAESYKDVVGFTGAVTRDSGSVAQETLFFDFDIITLTFQADGVYTVVPCVSDPVDILKEVTPPLEEKPWVADSISDAFKNAFNAQWFTNWGRWVLVAIAVVIGIVLIIVFFPVIVAVLKLIGRIFIAPFKAMKRSIDNRPERRARTKKTKNKNKRRKKNAKKRKES